MLETVDVGAQSIATYRTSAGYDVVVQLRELAAPLRGARVLHINATPYGGGVTEILRSEIPLLRDLGLVADWKIISGDDAFFAVTKTIHNGLQGAQRALTPAAQDIYMSYAARNARLLEESYDLIVVYDPQPLPLLQLHGKGESRWIWRCHIDSSEPNPYIWQFLQPFLGDYDAAVFTLGGTKPPSVPVERVVIPPAIDPEIPKNIELDVTLSRRMLHWIGVDTTRPLLTQVSRFDRWKDPLGVIAAFQIVKRDMPSVQLALVGSMALDDPEGWTIYREIVAASAADPDIHIFTNLTGVGNIEVNAFQRHSDVVIQKSLREGFGLVVSEALWKYTPVVAGATGGIPLQLGDGADGFLVDSIEACAAQTLWLLQHPKEAQEIARCGREVVRERFLLTRLIADELRLYGSLLGPAVSDHVSAAHVGLADEQRDPVCGMRLHENTPLTRSTLGIATPSVRRRVAQYSWPRRNAFYAHFPRPLWETEHDDLTHRGRYAYTEQI